MGKYTNWSFFKFYLPIMTTFWEKGGILFKASYKGGDYSRKYGIYELLCNRYKLLDFEEKE